LLKAAEDPELMRFILAERLGAIGSFRAALAQKLAVVAVALREAMALEHGAQNRPAEHVGEAALVLVLEACGQLLERGEEHAPALRKRAALQIRTLAAGAFRDGAQS
jgi:hypothetical protein